MLAFVVVPPKDVVDGRQYLAQIAGSGLTFGSFDGDCFSNNGYGYMDADSWDRANVLAVYEIPSAYAQGQDIARNGDLRPGSPFIEGTQQAVDFVNGVMDTQREMAHEPVA